MPQNQSLKNNRSNRRRRLPQPPTLRFTPTAWAKLLYLRDRGPTEVGGFGIAHPDDSLLVTDLKLVKQDCSSISVAFDDLAVAEFFDALVDQGLRPVQFARVWIHTHPGDSPQPSPTDEETFARAFGQTDWAVMFILAQGGQTYCRLEYHRPPACALEIPVQVEFRESFDAADHAAWDAEYRANVQELLTATVVESFTQRDAPDDRGDVTGALAAVGADSHWGRGLFLEPEEYWYGRYDE
jgi:proteasome lid subunit RPN8/RPN11